MPGSKRSTDSAIHAFLEGAGTGDDRIDAVLGAIAALPAAPNPSEDLIGQLAAATGDAAPPPTIRAAHSKPLPRRWQRRAVFSTILSSIAGKIAIAGVALATTTGGLAATDSLPAPAQQVVSDVAARLGITLPAPDHDDLATTAGHAENEDERVAQELPAGASDTARRVIEMVFGGDPQAEGAEFGRRVADNASNGNNDRGRDNGHGQPDEIPAGPPSDPGGGTPASPSSPRP